MDKTVDNGFKKRQQRQMYVSPQLVWWLHTRLCCIFDRDIYIMSHNNITSNNDDAAYMQAMDIFIGTLPDFDGDDLLLFSQIEIH